MSHWKSKFFILAVSILALGLVACEARTDKAAHGGVLLSISDFDGLPVGVSVSNAVNVNGGLVQLGSVTIDNIPADPNGATSDLMNVEIVSYEVVFTRADSGTRVPAKLVRGIFGVAPVGGTLDIDGLPVLTTDQLLHQPLLDLIRRGVDTETGSQVVVLNCTLRFFGRTLSGDPVETQPANFTIDFVP